jgi:hypothetical protein
LGTAKVITTYALSKEVPVPNGTSFLFKGGEDEPTWDME